MFGIDISSWQAGLTPSNLDIDFCIVKATEGVGYVDTNCDNFVQNCIDNNILWGFYHFARENSPEDEAQSFYENCKNYFGHGIPILDYETENYDNKDWCERFIAKIYELTGVWCIIYVSAYRCPQYNDSWIPEKCGLWVAGYPWDSKWWIEETVMPYDIRPFKHAAIWQFTSQLKLVGWNENLDGNVAYMNKESWLKYCYPQNNPQNVENSKSVDDYVLEVLLGEYGNNEDRKKMLGDKYEEVQNRINELYKIADEVIAGKWGNNWNREQALNGAGYPYDIVQRIVNTKLL